MEPGRDDREESVGFLECHIDGVEPLWSPVVTTGKRLQPQVEALSERLPLWSPVVTTGKSTLVLGDAGKVVEMPLWSPVVTTGKRPPLPREHLRLRHAAMEPGRDDREEPRRSRGRRRRGRGRYGARS